MRSKDDLDWDMWTNAAADGEAARAGAEGGVVRPANPVIAQPTRMETFAFGMGFTICGSKEEAIHS